MGTLVNTTLYTAALMSSTRACSHGGADDGAALSFFFLTVDLMVCKRGHCQELRPTEDRRFNHATQSSKKKNLRGL